MNPEVKAKWLEALRSGEYKQGREYLRRGNYYCCLGVLCDIAVKEGVISENRDGGRLSVSTFGVFGPNQVEGWAVSETSLPQAVVEWAELSDGSPEVFYEVYEDEGPKSMELVVLNDDERLTFDQIAPLIEGQF